MTASSTFSGALSGGVCSETVAWVPRDSNPESDRLKVCGFAVKLETQKRFDTRSRLRARP